MKINVALAALCFTVSGALSLSGQSASAFARLNQDVQLLSERLGRLQLKVDVLERENAQLLQTVDTQQRALQQLSASFESYSSAMDARLANEVSHNSTALKKDIIADVNKQIEALAKEFNKALEALAKAQLSTPQITTTVEFDDDYPQDGVPYEVQRGDTLSGIAKRFNSTIRDIQNANKIANPAKDLKVGDIIFIPQQKPE